MDDIAAIITDIESWLQSTPVGSGMTDAEAETLLTDGIKERLAELSPADRLAFLGMVIVQIDAFQEARSA